ncbi:MAG: hypothetical protein J7501_09030 [Bdellovibrio sp.]|nr:hypothetical protein [Bdellovibrio sp.]
MKLILAAVMTLPMLASAAVTEIRDYKTYDCQITTGNGGEVFITGNLMTLSIDEHIGRFFQEHLMVGGQDVQLQVLIEETANTSTTGEVILLQNLKVNETETSVEIVTKDVEQTSARNKDVAASCKISR